VNYRFQDFNSGNLKFLSFEKNSRNLANQKLRTINQNLNDNSNMGFNSSIATQNDYFSLYLNNLSN
jgi:hypothetical protein